MDICAIIHKTIHRSPGIAVLSALCGAVIFPCILTGCISEDMIWRDVENARLEAYRTWERRRAGDVRSEAFLKGDLTQGDAVKVALRFNRDLQQVLADKEFARGQVLESYSAALPNVSVLGNYTRRDSTGVPGAGFLDNYSADLQVVQPVYRGGQIPAALRAARLVTLLTDERLRGTTQQVVFRVMKTYYDALLAKRMYEVNLSAVASAETQLEYVTLEHEQGAKSDFDVLRAKVDVANFRAEMIRYKNAELQAKAALLKILGVSQESLVDLTDSLTYYPMKPVFQEAVRVAYQNRPDLHTGEMNLRLQEEAVRVARSRYFPTLSAFYTRTWANPDPVRPLTDDEWGNSWIAGGRAEMTLFDGFAREGKLKQEKATLTKRQIELLDTQEQAQLEVQQEILNLKSAEELVESQRVNVQQARRGLELAEAGFREGVNTQLQVIDSRTALIRAEGNFSRAVYDHSLARLRLKLAMGILGPGAGDRRAPDTLPVTAIRAEEFYLPDEDVQLEE